MPLTKDRIEPRLSLANIEAAALSIDSVFLRTPQFLSEPLSKRFATRLILKIETVNPIRSFKGRGADLFIAGLTSGSTHLVCASAGNFGQALAYSARRRGLRVVIFAAETANPLKIKRMRELGAEVRLAGQDLDDAKACALSFAGESGGRFIEDGREPRISEGAGTIALELCQWPSVVDCVLVPLGNGALLAGIGTWMKSKSPATRVVGVCAAGAPAMALSWRKGAVRTTKSVSTVADGIAIRVPIPDAVVDLKHVVDDILLVEDRALIEAVQLTFRHHGLIAEPAGVAGLAAIITYRNRFRGITVATPVCGGNLSREHARRWLRPYI
jgi:threonine dehydratase